MGITLGLFVVTGALVLMSSLTISNRNLLIETRLIQDLRTSSDFIARDLRRAGYWAGASGGVYVPGSNASIPQNAYRKMIPSSCDDATAVAAAAVASSPASPASSPVLDSICYYVEQGASNNSTSTAELFGFKLSSGILYAFVGGNNPQALSDPNNVTISQFKITPSPISVDLSGNCTSTPAVAPTVVVREFAIEIRGYPPSDTSMVRAVRTNVRVRNDAISGGC